MFLDAFDENWSAAMTINNLLLSIVSVLYHPLLD
jgi:ubiquitin-protein ligase